MTAAPLSQGHQEAIADLHRIVRASNKRLMILHLPGAADPDGLLPIEMELDCTGVTAENGGVSLQKKERVTVLIPSGFPFEQPVVVTHNVDLATQQHVLWGQFICLYETEDDWDGSDGMMGFIDRLATWFLRAASGTLDAPGEPIDPPITRSSASAGCVVVEKQMPEECARKWAGGLPWFGAAVLSRVDDNRVDVLSWIGVEDGDYGPELFKTTANDLEKSFGQSLFLAPTIVLPDPMTFEFPLTVGELVLALVEQQIPMTTLIALITYIAWINRSRVGLAGPSTGTGGAAPAIGSRSADQAAASAMYVFIGSPMRGTAGTAERQTHLAAWRLGGDEAQLVSRLAQLGQTEGQGPVGMTPELAEQVLGWILEAPIRWAKLYERRPDIVQRRDGCRPAEWLRQNGGRTVLILGCGALGAPIAEQCLRGGARKLILVDNKDVTPGVLIRQPYDDSDIGHSKAEALARKLSYVGLPDPEVEPRVVDAMDVIAADGAVSGIDLIIDATANQTVATMIELKRWTSGAVWPPILTVSIGHLAERGFATLSLPGATGAGVDLIRKLALASHAERELGEVASDFFPERPRADVFVPEPGCSTATFRGSAAEVQALAAGLFAGMLGDLCPSGEATQAPTMSARVLELANAADGGVGAAAELEWPADVIVDEAVTDGEPGYQIRLGEAALADMRYESLQTRDSKGPTVETGGTLFGQIDAAARVVWVTSATGPAPGSVQSEAEYEYGTEGLSNLRDVLRKYSAGRLRFVGMWHIHPFGEAKPSDKDDHAMRDEVGPVGQTPRRSLLIILGGRDGQWENWLSGGDLPQIYARLVNR